MVLPKSIIANISKSFSFVGKWGEQCDEGPQTADLILSVPAEHQTPHTNMTINLSELSYLHVSHVSHVSWWDFNILTIDTLQETCLICCCQCCQFTKNTWGTITTVFRWISSDRICDYIKQSLRTIKLEGKVFIGKSGFESLPWKVIWEYDFDLTKIFTWYQSSEEENSILLWFSPRAGCTVVLYCLFCTVLYCTVRKAGREGDSFLAGPDRV